MFAKKNCIFDKINSNVTSFMTKIGSNIKKIRATKNLSQQSFAELFDLTRGNISSYEESRAEPKMEVVMNIAKYFSIPLQDLIAKSLTVNEILKFNADNLITDENHLNKLQLREVPFINDNVYMKCCHGEIPFNQWDAFPKLILPETANNNLIALTFNNNIPHHEAQKTYQMNDVLVFEEITANNFHLCTDKIGLYVDESELCIGMFVSKNGKLNLVLNDLKKHLFQVNAAKTFWKLFAVYSHE